jgi:ABC-type Mn2+/Zn2+ transport system ATPase subunit
MGLYSLVAIIGEIGSCKSSLLAAILDEMSLIAGNSNMHMYLKCCGYLMG